MMKNLLPKKKRDVRKAAKIDLTAESARVNKRTVQRALSGEVHNERILSIYYEFDEGINLLLENVKLLVPFKP